MNKKVPLVSIVMPSFNVAEFIVESINSVIEQTLEDWELIIVDDCSTDNTVSAITPLLSDPRIILISTQKNVGGAGARNLAVEKARGRYIAFLDSDDLWTSDKLAVQISMMQRFGWGFCFASYTNINEQGEILSKIDVPDRVNFNSLLRHNYIGCLTAVYDKEIHGKIYMPLVKKRQDFALWLEILKKFEFGYSVNSNLGYYRIRKGSLSRNKLDAIRYYWRVLRNVGNCNVFSAAINLACYLCIVFIKKKNIEVYNKYIIGR